MVGPPGRRGRVNEQMSDQQPDDASAPIEFRPSLDAQVVPEGTRDLAIVFLGASLVAGVGDPKGQGWVTRVVGRTQHPDLELTAYNLGVRGDTSADVLAPLGHRGAAALGRPHRAPRRALRRHQRRRRAASPWPGTGSTSPTCSTTRPPRVSARSSSARRPRPTPSSTSGSRCSSTPRPTCAPAAACRSSTASPRSWATTSGAPTSPPAASTHHPGQAGYGLIAWLVLHNGWDDWLQIS